MKQSNLLRLGLIGLSTFAMLTLPSFANSASLKSRGEIAMESRAFLPDDNAATTDYGIGMFSRVEASLRYKRYAHKLRVSGRLDAVDKQRTTLLVEEVWSQYKNSKISIRLGADIINWTATEAFHPADIINARNLDSDFENLEKLGEPMLAVAVRAGRGNITAFLMPFYTEPILASPSSRLNFAQGLPTKPGRVQLAADGSMTTKDFGPQAALHFDQTIKTADLSVHVVHHLDRAQPLVVPDNGGTPVPDLLFQTLTQVGGTYAQAVNALLLKLEWSYRYFHRPNSAVTRIYGPLDQRDHGTVAIGSEYSIIHDNSSESTLLLEAQAIFAKNAAQRYQAGIFQRDILAGYRYALNDIKGRELLATIILDLENAGELQAAIAYQQRLSDVWGIETSIRTIHTPKPPTTRPERGFEPLRDADMVRLQLSRYF